MKDQQTPDFDFSLIRELRHKQGLSLEQVAEETMISYATLSRIESGRSQPNLQTIKRLANFLGLTPSSLLDLATVEKIERTKQKGVKLLQADRQGISFANLKLRLGRGQAGQDDEKPHRHPGNHQITWVLEGKVIIKIGDAEHQLHSGEALKFNAGIEHTVRPIKEARFLVALIPTGTG